MPVDAVHGALHAVIECHTRWSPASRLSNVIDCPSVTVGILPPAALRSPAPYSKLPIGIAAGQRSGAGPARIGELRLRPAVVVVLGQVTVGEHAGLVDWAR